MRKSGTVHLHRLLFERIRRVPTLFLMTAIGIYNPRMLVN